MITEQDIADHNLPEWIIENKGLEKTFKFATFAEAIAFTVRLAFEAERQNHHPDLSVSWNKVTVRLITHDQGGVVTDKDLNLAIAIEAIL